jgi:hypothetical protein
VVLATPSVRCSHYRRAPARRGPLLPADELPTVAAPAGRCWEATWAAFDWTTHVFPIAATSPAVDAGALGTPASRDQIGQPRPADGDRNGDPVEDLGAYE